MRDSVKFLSGHREKKASSNGGKPFYVVAEEHPPRIDLRWSDGLRRGIPYAHIHGIEYWPAEPNSGSPALETIIIDCPAYSRIQITGLNLSEVYEALSLELVDSIRERDANESALAGQVFIDEVNHVAFTDWQLELEAIESNREAVLGKRKFPKASG